MMRPRRRERRGGDVAINMSMQTIRQSAAPARESARRRVGEPEIQTIP